MIALAVVCGLLALACVRMWAAQRHLAHLAASRAPAAALAEMTARLDRSAAATKAADAAATMALQMIEGRLEGLVAQIADRAETVDARLARLEATRPRVELSPEQRAEMAAAWGEVCCPHCGYAHAGVCSRVKHQTVEQITDGTRISRVVTATEFWPNDAWRPPEGAISAADVFATPLPIPPAAEPATNGQRTQ